MEISRDLQKLSKIYCHHIFMDHVNINVCTKYDKIILNCDHRELFFDARICRWIISV